MQIQYIYDTTGKKTGVIIPIEEWEEGKKITHVEGQLSGFDPACYRCLLRGIRDKVEKELTKSRSEWTHR